MTRPEIGGKLPVAMATLALVIAGSGTAIAANGRPAVLGANNHTTRTTTLRDSNGTPLALLSGHGKPPLTVGRDTATVPSLNAALLGSIPAASFGNNLTVLGVPGTYTVKVPVGLHYALLTAVGGGGSGGANTVSTTGYAAGGGGEGGVGVVVLPVTAGERLTAVVGSGGTSGADGTLSSVRPSTMSASDWAVKAMPGMAGGAAEMCLSTADAGQGGAVLGPTAAVGALGAVGIHATPGAAGSPSACAEGFAFGGSGAGPFHVAGSGGSGRASQGSTAPGAEAGRSGVVTIEFLG
jgi:hypothetical protein